MRIVLTFLISLCFTLTVNDVFAREKYVQGVGHFYTQEDDNLIFIKEQLIYNAFKDIITKSLKELALDADNFWLTYDAKFEDHFKTIQEKLEAKYLEKKMGDDGKEFLDDPDGKKQEAYSKILRKTRLAMKRKFMKIGKTMNKWVVTSKISRSTQDSMQRSISIKAMVDRKLLNDIYDEVMGKVPTSGEKKLYITANYTLEDVDWGNLGVDSRQDFTNLIIKSWVDWFNKQKSSQIEEVKVAGSDLESQLLKHLSLSHEKLKKDSDSNIRNGVWLKLNINIKKIRENVLLNDITFEFSGDIALFNLRDNRAIFDQKIEMKEESYQTHNLTAFMNALVSYIYRMPLEHFAQVNMAVSSLVDRDYDILTVKNVFNVKELFSLMQFMSSQGIRIDLSPELKTYQISQASLLLHHKGSTDEFEKFLLSLKNAKLKSGIVIKLDGVDTPYTMRLQRGL